MTPREVHDAVIAAPREAGTEGAARAVALLSTHLRERGWTVREQRFRFQPASLLAFPLLGAGLGWLTLLELPLLLGRFPAVLAPLVWFGGAAALGLLAWGIGTGVEVPGAERREDVNLVATRDAEPVRRWLVAHVDTKAQGHSMAGRLVAVWVMGAAGLVLSGLVLWRPFQADPLPGWAVGVGAGLSLAGGALAARGRLRGGTVGARDNGTGLLALLTAADGLSGAGTGLVLTGAEEFGLVGARVLARTLEPAGVEVVNLDTLTDQGTLYLVAHDARGEDLAGRLAPALGGITQGLRVRRLPAGILTDSLPFARAGCAAVTIGRLSWADLRRLHTPRDTPEALSLNTAEAVGRALGAAR
ncbi:MAG: M28 family peptidase [Gemmatimonadetes bacterium]|nr:M28 family peptidase [Gemmatimonadota bacterium]MBP9200023.1 M28 family peptidase [Gemmatimonadales bacterium]MBK7349166.1 M28 family peptidase [Gemmatimonadota bacterium]MBK7714731.1 M28 family peptidase [Gemmatimonadota bacterium]MBK7783795.1 M28 family peptidase [Gemmatimonadota bacterium]